MTSAENTDIPQLGFDPDFLRERYKLEREKRLRDDGIEQFIEVAGDFSNYVDDPHIDEEIKREPRTDEVEVLLIGGGFGGLQAGARLREAGVEDICIIEKGGSFGGTWYWNRYPGAQCDTESYVYLPLLEELSYVPTEKYVRASEIRGHCEAIARHYGLNENALFQTEVTEMRWDESAARWLVSTNKNDRIKARYVAMANGPLHRPKLPGIAGISDFEGHTFHTSRWDYEYTGGDADGGLDGLQDKRVAVIGTGATSVQCVPHVGETAKQLFVFQRTPSSIDVRGNAPTDPDWAEDLKPGWQRARVENFNNLLSGVPQAEDLVNDGWTSLAGRLRDALKKSRAGAGSGRSTGEVIELANMEKMEEIRARVDDMVSDPNVSEKLKPYYPLFCKRPCFHDDYLATFDRPNVELVDTNGQGVERITKDGITVDGKEYKVDCIIFATGFEVGTGFARRAGYEIVGKQGRTLTQKWEEEGVRTLHGLQVHEFPNCFIMSQTQGAFTANFTHMLDEAATHLSHIIKHARDNGYRTIEASKEAEDAWLEAILEKTRSAMPGGIGGRGCTPSYYNTEGKPTLYGAQGGPYGGGSVRFFEILKDWRDEGSLAGIDFGA